MVIGKARHHIRVSGGEHLGIAIPSQIEKKAAQMIQKFIHYINRYRYHRTHNMLPSLEGGSGASGQDMLVYELLGKKDNGIFIDIGANDGLTISNTYFLEKNCDWSGIAIEPIPSIFEKLKSNRSCDVIHGCVTPKSGKAKFLELVGGLNMLSTLSFNNTGLTARRLRKNAKRSNSTINEIDVECYTLHSLAEKYNLKYVDFLSIDTEGGELEILKSINFDKLPVKIISVENNYYTRDIRNHLESCGFLYLGTFKIDEIYLFGGDQLKNKMIHS